MRVLVTGGAGFIGRHVAERFVADGHQVLILDNLATGSSADGPPSAELLVGDVSDPVTVDVITSEQPDVIVHAAAQVSVPRSMADPALDRRVNVDGTANVIAGAKGVRARVVFLSTGGAIYGETAKPATEKTLPLPKSYYGAHKYLAERYLEYAGVSHAIARLANVYGPGQRSDQEGGVAAIFAERLAAKQAITIYGDGTQTRDLVHVRDVADAVASMAVSDQNGLWNVGSGTSVAIGELLVQMEAVLGPSLVTSYEAWRPGDVRHSCLAIGKIGEDLGWAPQVGLDEGIRTLVRKP